MSQITEIAPDVFKIATFISEGNIQFSQFLVRDEEPLLYHTGMKGLFPTVKEAVAKLIDHHGTADPVFYGSTSHGFHYLDVARAKDLAKAKARQLNKDAVLLSWCCGKSGGRLNC